MNCVICGNKMKMKKEQLFHYTDCGLSRVYLQGISIAKCLNQECNNEEFIIPNLEELHELLAQTLAHQKTRLLPEEIRFLRIHLGFSGTDFAKKVMKVTPETVTRWEKGTLQMKETIELFLRVLIITNSKPLKNYNDFEEFGSVKIKIPLKRIFESAKDHWIKKAG